MRVVIIISTGGAVFQKSLEILLQTGSQIEFIMISDRECEGENIAKQYGLLLKRIEEKDNQKFSIKCKEFLDKIQGIDVIITFFKRLLTIELINAYPCVNIHPALLPAFKGFRAIEQAYESGVRFIGGTLHMIDEEIDHGAIIAQIQTPIPQDITLKKLTHMAFLQDVYLFLLLIDLLETKKIKFEKNSNYKVLEKLEWNDRCNPCIRNIEYINKLRLLQGEYDVFICK